MASFIWNRDINEAYMNPYEYDAQSQFVREARRFLELVFAELLYEKFIYSRDEKSLEKAIYMLHLDSIESLRDSLDLLELKKHQIASRVLRDVFENNLLCNYFYNDKSSESKKNLKKWFKNEVITNSICRNSIESRLGEEVKKSYSKYYSELSKITHRTYKTLAYGYVLGRDDKLIYEGRSSDGFLVAPHVISMYLAVIAGLIKDTANEIGNNCLISQDKIDNIWSISYEIEATPRRFKPNQNINRQKNELIE